MKKSLLSAVALTALVAFSGSAWADIIIGVAGPITGPNAAFGAQLQKGAEQAAADINAAGGINGEQIKHRHRRRRLRSEAGHLGRQQVRRRRRQVRRRPLQLGRLDPGLGSLCRERHPRDHACRDQPGLHRARPVEHVPHLRPRRPAGRHRRRVSRRQVQGRQDRRRPRQDPVRPGPCRRDQEGDERRRRHGSHV